MCGVNVELIGFNLEIIGCTENALNLFNRRMIVFGILALAIGLNLWDVARKVCCVTSEIECFEVHT